jgi:uncharacterized protein (DUF433 family)
MEEVKMTQLSLSDRSLIDTLHTPAYYIADISRLIGISKGRISRYLRGYRYTYSVNEQEIKGKQKAVVDQSLKGSSYASFLELIDLLYIKELLKRGFTLQYIRKALKEAEEYLGTPHFARSVFFTSHHNIMLKLPKDGNIVALLSGGQFGLKEVIDMFWDKLDFENISEFGFARRWYPNGKRGGIVIDPQISFGKPTIIGRGIATQNIYDLYLGEGGSEDPVSKWFNIPVTEIETAVQFEHSLKCA